MRKQINGLSQLVQDELEYLGEHLFTGHLFLFCNRQRNRLKILYWDKNGFCLWMKRLERDKFPWPHTIEAAQEITPKQLKQLLSGIDFFHAHKPLENRTLS